MISGQLITISNPMISYDTHGDRSLHYGNDITQVRAVLAPENGGEENGKTDLGVTRMVAYLLPGAPVSRDSQLIIDGEVFEVDGEPKKWDSVSGQLDFIETHLVKRET